MIRVQFLCSPEAREVVVVDLTLPDGATLQQALRAAAADPRLACLNEGSWEAGIWGRRQSTSTLLSDADRVEAYRALRCDPKESRRLRYRQAHARTPRLAHPP